MVKRYVSYSGIRIEETSRRIELLNAQLQAEWLSMAQCKACLDFRSVPIDGYLREEIQDHRNLQRPCSLCARTNPPQEVNKTDESLGFTLWVFSYKLIVLLNAGWLIFAPAGSLRWPTLIGFIASSTGLFITLRRK
jgi:hypothetical protein